ncbi:MAG: hypothetical protein H0X47_12660, partial [Nitrospirales bacterium]|nr:hypothetical protein [Nitrospirales bacterium]
KEIIDAKVKKRPSRVKGEKAPSGKVINIMDALRKSVEQSKGGKISPKQSEKNTAKKSSAKKKSAAKKKSVA